MPLVALLNGKALTALGRYDEAEVCLRAAEKHLRTQGARTSLRRALTQLATLYQQMGRADDASTHAERGARAMPVGWPRRSPMRCCARYSCASVGQPAT